MIVVDNVSFHADQHKILKNISVSLKEKRIAIIGKNGSGKSTFARLLNGLALPSSGSVSIDGMDSKKQGAAVRKLVGFLFQNPDNQIVYPTVAEDLAFGLKNQKLPSAEIATRVNKALSDFQLSALKNRLIHTLSGGEKQLVALLGVCIMQPKYIVLDEPTTFLDRVNSSRFINQLLYLPQHVILVTHNLDLIDNFDRVLCLDSGEIAFDDEAKKSIRQYTRVNPLRSLPSQ